MRMTAQESPLAKYGFVPLNQSDIESSESVQPEQNTQTQTTNKESPLAKYGFTPLEQTSEQQNTQTQEWQKTETPKREGLTGMLEDAGDYFRKHRDERLANKEKTEPYTYAQRFMQLGRGVTNTYAGLKDLLSQYGAYPVLLGAEKGLEAVGAKDAAKTITPYKESMGDSTTLHDSQKWWNEQAGRDITPKDDTGKQLNLLGEFFAPLPVKGGGSLKEAIAGKTVKESIKNVADLTGTNIARSVGAAEAMHLADERFFSKENSPFLNFIDGWLESVAGAALGEKTYGGAKSRILQKLGHTVHLTAEQLAKQAAKQSQKEALEEIGNPNITQRVIGKVLSKTVKKDERWEELIKAAKEEGVDLPFNVALGGGKFKNLLANNIFKSMFTAKSYNNVITNADTAMVNGLKEVIESVHPSKSLRGEASESARNFLKSESEAVMKEQKQLYDYAETLIKPEDKVSIAPFIERADKILKSMSDSPSGARATVYNKILDIYKKWGLLSKADQKVADELSSWVGKLTNSGDATIPQHIIDSVSNIGRSNKKDAQILASKVENLRKDWNQLYDPAKQDFSKMFGSLTGGLKESLKTSSNKEYTNAVFAADKFHEVNVANRIRTDMAQSLMKGEVPKEAFQYMDSPQRVKQLSHIMGESEQAKEVMQSLKRAKLNEIIYEKAIDGQSALITEGGHIKYGALASNLIKSHNVELIKELLDPEAFQQLQRLAKISKGFYESGREIGTNTSVTAIASSDIGKFNKGLDSVITALSASLGASLGGISVEGVALAFAPIAAIKGFSFILSDKKIIDSAIMYAKAAVKNDTKRMDRILEHLQQRVNDLRETKEGWSGGINFMSENLNEWTEKKTRAKDVLYEEFNKRKN